ncbi:MAG: helix-turn-helix transcriptional regulator, partial [Holosporaceae bacterium]|nr:helix-turn-helix transcriptional regulator [Holosporaceae bacterium]
MARQSLSPMKETDFNDINQLESRIGERVGRKRKDTPMTHLKYLRKRSGYTLETLSEITSISISYLSRLEAGSRRLNT